MHYCLKCGHEVEGDDNFCPECGHWTARGYSFLRDKSNEKIINGAVMKSYDKLGRLFVIMASFMVIFFIVCYFRGTNIFKPITYVKHQILNQKYGYNTTVIKTDNQYFNKDISSLEEAKKFIQDDFSKQQWECYNDIENSFVEETISKDYEIPSVTFCEINLEEINKIKSVIDEIYNLFPDIRGYLTNITLMNAKNSKDYVAYFQPLYQFTNSTNDINEYNKINKTQILLNSYYFLNNDNLNGNVLENWYVKDATYESLIAHEFGHYISFVSLLKNNGVDNVIFVTRDNFDKINEVLKIVNEERYSKELVTSAISNYNVKYNTSIGVDEFAGLISNYASAKSSKGEIVYDEVIAESIHDYYLHKNNSSPASLEIIYILKESFN